MLKHLPRERVQISARIYDKYDIAYKQNPKKSFTALNITCLMVLLFAKKRFLCQDIC